MNLQVHPTNSPRVQGFGALEGLGWEIDESYLAVTSFPRAVQGFRVSGFQGLKVSGFRV